MLSAVRQLRVAPIVVIVAIALAACTPAEAPPPAPEPPKPAEAPAPAPPEKPAEPPAAKPAEPAPPKPAEPAPAKPAPDAKPDYDEQAVADFYRGQTFRMLIPYSAGGGFDTIYRLWGRNADRHIPGNPTIIAENMTGAGGLIAVNHLYNVAPKDGSVMGTMDLFVTVLGQIADSPGREFDVGNFQWIGNPGDTAPAVCAIRSDLGWATWSEFEASGEELVFGASGTGNVFYATPNVVKEATGANVRVVDGYGGNPDVRAAVERGELDGACWGWSSMRTTAAHWFEGDPAPMTVVLQTGTEPYPGLEDVELLRDFVDDPDLLRMVEVLEHAVYHVYLAAFPPGVPADRVAALRDAFLKTWEDPATRDDLARTQLEFSPVSGEETEQVINELLQTPPELGAEIGRVFGLLPN